MESRVYQLLKKYADSFHPVVPFNATTEQLLKLDFTANNPNVTESVITNIDAFTGYVQGLLVASQCKYGIGGYNENRTVYSRSRVFDGDGEPRRLHLGIDIWGAAGTPVYTPLGGMVHSFAFNDKIGDYGATIILQHQVDGLPFNTLYGHLSIRDLSGLQEGQYISRGVEFAHFGKPHENGYWPPHLHFQIVEEMHQYEGDYPGVCAFSERYKYLANSPDPDVILNLMRYAK